MKLKDFMKTVGIGAYELWVQKDETVFEPVATKIDDMQLKDLVNREGYGEYEVTLIYPVTHFKHTRFELLNIPAISITITK